MNICLFDNHINEDTSSKAIMNLRIFEGKVILSIDGI